VTGMTVGGFALTKTMRKELGVTLCAEVEG
jgi:hypothetical protein